MCGCHSPHSSPSLIPVLTLDSFSRLRQSRSRIAPMVKLQTRRASHDAIHRGRRWGAGVVGADNRCAGSAPAKPHSWGGATSGRVAGRRGVKQPLAR